MFYRFGFNSLIVAIIGNKELFYRRIVECNHVSRDPTAINLLHTDKEIPFAHPSNQKSEPLF